MDTDCCVVGAGPAGAMLSLLLARQGARVTLLEKHGDFDRDFRGDTLHPSTLELLDQIGLARSLLELPHQKVERAQLTSPAGSFTAADFSRLNSKFPFVALMPQERFLEFLVGESKQYDGFELRMGANVRELIRDDPNKRTDKDRGRVSGVVFNDNAGMHQVTAPLTVACDGRFSRVRKAVGLEPIKTSPPMDILWFRLPRFSDIGGQNSSEPPPQLMGRIGPGTMLIVLPREDHDQVGLVILKGSFRQMRNAGIDAFQKQLLEIAPTFGRHRVETITDWNQITPLSVESSRLRKWHLPGLLLIGDAAHVMSPVGGVGINYAIQDAVATANLLGSQIKACERISNNDLDAVRRRREFPTRVIQRFQTLIQQRVIRVALDRERPFRPPWFLGLPIVRRLPARLIGFGVRRERIANMN